MSVAGVLNEPCTVWFAVVGLRVGMSFLGVLHSVRMVLLRFGDVSGCAEWAVPIVICCWWCEFWRWREIRFFCVPAVMAWVLGRWREIRPPPSTCMFSWSLVVINTIHAICPDMYRTTWIYIGDILMYLMIFAIQGNICDTHCCVCLEKRMNRAE